MENEENKIKKEILLVLGLVLFIILIAEFVWSLNKNTNLSGPKKVLPTLAPNGPLKTPTKPKVLNSGTFPIILSDKGFSQKAVLLMGKGSNVLLINTASKAVVITETSVSDTIATYNLEVGKSTLPIALKDSGDFKFSDDRGNILNVFVQ